MVVAVVVRRRCCGKGSGSKPVLAGAASARYFMARWNGNVGSLGLKLVASYNRSLVPGF